VLCEKANDEFLPETALLALVATSLRPQLLVSCLGCLVAGVDRRVVRGPLHAALQRLQNLHARLNHVELVLLVLGELRRIGLALCRCRGLRADRKRARKRGTDEKHAGTKHCGTSELSLG